MVRGRGTCGAYSAKVKQRASGRRPWITNWFEPKHAPSRRIGLQEGGSHEASKNGGAPRTHCDFFSHLDFRCSLTARAVCTARFPTSTRLAFSTGEAHRSVRARGNRRSVWQDCG